MASSAPEFRPVELQQRRPVWPFAVVGAAAVAAALIFFARRESDRGPAKPVVLSNVAAKVEPKAVAQAIAEPAKPEAPKVEAAQSPNVIGGAVAAAVKAAGVVPASELDRERARTRGAQKAAAVYKKQLDDLNKQLVQA